MVVAQGTGQVTGSTFPPHIEQWKEYIIEGLELEGGIADRGATLLFFDPKFLLGIQLCASGSPAKRVIIM